MRIFPVKGEGVDGREQSGMARPQAGVLEPEDAWRWMDLDTPVEKAAHIAQTRSLPTEAFTWWKVDRAVNRPDPNNNSRELLKPISESV